MWKKIKWKAFMGQESKYYLITTITKQKFKTLFVNQQTVISKQTFYSTCQQNSWYSQIGNLINLHNIFKCMLSIQQINFFNGGKFLKELWSASVGEYNRVIEYYQQSW